jgi:hypothetical protein
VPEPAALCVGDARSPHYGRIVDAWREKTSGEAWPPALNGACHRYPLPPASGLLHLPARDGRRGERLAAWRCQPRVAHLQGWARTGTVIAILHEDDRPLPELPAFDGGRDGAGARRHHFPRPSAAK